jgi:hypothetical protein
LIWIEGAGDQNGWACTEWSMEDFPANPEGEPNENRAIVESWGIFWAVGMPKKKFPKIWRFET